MQFKCIIVSFISLLDLLIFIVNQVKETVTNISIDTVYMGATPQFESSEHLGNRLLKSDILLLHNHYLDSQIGSLKCQKCFFFILQL